MNRLEQMLESMATDPAAFFVGVWLIGVALLLINGCE